MEQLSHLGNLAEAYSKSDSTESTKERVFGVRLSIRKTVVIATIPLLYRLADIIEFILY